jgi:hypothetical protein
MLIPDIIVAMQIRNTASALEAVAEDRRIVEHYGRELQHMADSLRDLAVIVEKLPPWHPE